MVTRIVITHLNRSKVNQIEQWPLDSIQEIAIGRDQASTMAFDLQRDDMVSRRHAVIRIVPGEPPSFKIADLGSSNGTLVNGMRISQEVELLPGDVVELGANGPKFNFDVQPRPAELAERTRVVPLGGMAGTTRLEPLSNTTPRKEPGPDHSRPALSAPQPAQNRTVLFVAAALLVVLIVASGAIFYSKGSGGAGLFGGSKPADMSPLEVAQKFSNATAYISMQWRLYDKETGKRVFHKMVLWKTKDNLVPAYVKLPNGTIVRWLTTEDEGHTNEVIGAEGSGSGFVVDGQGFLLTNKHVAAGWKVEYGFKPYEANGALFTLDSSFKVANVTDFDPTSSEALYHWTPDSGGIVFDNKSPVPLSASDHLFEGRNEQLDIRFPGQRVSYASRLIRASADADVAEIRIDSVQGLPAVDLEKDDGIKVGERVTVMGYPGISEQKIATIVTHEVGREQEHQELIPEPTVTDGLIAKIGTGAKQQGGVMTTGTMGDVYQLTVLATGAGNSGGPVFNAAGRVIGLFTYAKTRGAERVTFAVPIHYGRDLLAPQRVN
ncbi:MAG: trypsin-like peptidase domain-containing protein [Aliidongia sp.]